MRALPLLSFAATLAALAACGDDQPATAPAAGAPGRSASASQSAVEAAAAAPAAGAKPPRFTAVQSEPFDIAANTLAARTVSCPVGSTPVGGGYHLAFQGSYTAPPIITGSLSTADGWRVMYTNTLVGSDKAIIMVHVICAT